MAGITPINPMFGGYPALNSIRAIDLDKTGIAADKIQGIGVTKTNEVRPDAAGGFDNLLTDFVKQVDEKQQIANTTVQGLLSGDNVPVHQAVISMEEANIAFSLMVEVRNKLVDAYQELMRMQI